MTEVPDPGEGDRDRLVVDPREEMAGVVAELGRGERKVNIIWKIYFPIYKCCSACSR
jgi:hypothetical protein